jgi:hypothetical protein
VRQVVLLFLRDSPEAAGLSALTLTDEPHASNNSPRLVEDRCLAQPPGHHALDMIVW